MRQSKGAAVWFEELLDGGVDGKGCALAQRKQDCHEFKAATLFKLVEGDGGDELGGEFAIECHEDQRAIAAHQAEPFGEQHTVQKVDCVAW